MTICKHSPMNSLALQTPEKRQEFLARLNKQQLRILRYQWRNWKARPDQLAPPDKWKVWLILAGRGFGKTRSGAEWVREQVESGAARRIALVAETATDARTVMVEGESGILAISPPRLRPLWEPSKRQLTWPNGAIATTYSGDEPDQLRGPQHDAAWADEPAKWKYPTEVWDNLEMGLRLGSDPRIVATTTPRPIPLLRELLKDPMTKVTRGSTYDNLVNLTPDFIERMRTKYEGTRLGRQELYAEMLEDTPGALWTHATLESARVRSFPPMERIVIGIDPAVTSGENADDTGIIVAGLGEDGFYYILRDLSCHLSPAAWGRRVINAYREYGADRIIAEVNNGGDMVEHTLLTIDANAPYKSVHASRGKRARAEPVASLYEQGKVRHVVGCDNAPSNEMDELEKEMCSFVPGNMDHSPDRVDALVWAMTELALEEQIHEEIVVYEDRVHISPF
jgi:phage terminase large subunit-like protein